MLGAIVAIVPELATRKNMTPEWRQQLQHMIDWISIYQLKSEKRAQIEEAA
jgi:hypothetical protein